MANTKNPAWRGVAASVLACGVIGVSSATAQTAWTNVSPSMVVSGEWSTASNWDVGVPGVGGVNLTARLTNEVNSYIVGVESAPTAFTTLHMSNSGENLTELRIGADMDFRPGLTHGFTLATMTQNCLMDVWSGTTAFAWNAQLAGSFRVRNGAKLISRHNSSTSGGLARYGNVTVESGGEWTAANGGMHQNGSVITVESGGTWNISNTSRMPSSHVAGGAIVVTNRGAVNMTHGNFQFGMNSGEQHTFFQEAGTFTVTSGKSTVFGTQNGSGITGRGNLLITGGLVSHEGTATMSVGINSDSHGRPATVQGLVLLSGGECRHATGLISVGGWGSTVISGSQWPGEATFYTSEDRVRGEIAVSGGKFSTRGNVLVANGPSRGFVTVSGGEFCVTNATGTASMLLGGYTQPTLLRSGIATLTVTNNGYVEIDRLIATNQVSGANYSIVNLHGGVLAARAITADNGVPFDVGDGTSAATLSLLGSTHTFADGLTLKPNAALEIQGSAAGSVSVNGDVTLLAGSTLRIDVTGVSGHDALNVVGGAVLAGTLALNFTDADPPNVKGPWTILSATGGVTGKFDEIPLGYSVKTVGNDVILEASRGTLIMLR